MIKRKESVLVIILAETREYQHSFERFQQNVLDALDADLCLCVADNEREDTNNPFYRRAKYVWRYPEPEDWGDAFDSAQRQAGHTADWRALLKVGNQWLGGIEGPDKQPGSAGILLFFRWFLKSQLIDTGVIDLYDRFIVTRSDFVHDIPHPPLSMLSPDQIWIPEGEEYGGHTDRHIIANRADILRVLAIADPILAEPTQLAAAMQIRSKWNLERFIKFSFGRMGISDRVRNYPYTMYSVRSEGGHTRWKKGIYDAQLGYFIKYPGEYKRSRLAAYVIGPPGDWSRTRIRLIELLVWCDSLPKQLSRRWKGAKRIPRRMRKKIIRFRRNYINKR